MSPLEGGWRWLHRLRSPVFGVVIGAFFLPFMTLACTVQPLQTQISGIQLMTGTQPSPSQTSIPQIQPQPAASLCFTAAWVGFASSFLRSRWGLWLPASSGAVGATLLLILKSRFEGGGGGGTAVGLSPRLLAGRRGIFGRLSGELPVNQPQPELARCTSFPYRLG
jgi:hypothetical protein